MQMIIIFADKTLHKVNKPVLGIQKVSIATLKIRSHKPENKFGLCCPPSQFGLVYFKVGWAAVWVPQN